MAALILDERCFVLASLIFYCWWKQNRLYPGPVLWPRWWSLITNKKLLLGESSIIFSLLFSGPRTRATNWWLFLETSAPRPPEPDDLISCKFCRTSPGSIKLIRFVSKECQMWRNLAIWQLFRPWQFFFFSRKVDKENGKNFGFFLEWPNFCYLNAMNIFPVARNDQKIWENIFTFWAFWNSNFWKLKWFGHHFGPN